MKKYMFHKAGCCSGNDLRLILWGFQVRTTSGPLPVLRLLWFHLDSRKKLWNGT